MGTRTSTKQRAYRFVLSYTYALPTGRRQRFAVWNKVIERVIGDWQSNRFTPVWSISSATTGMPRPTRIRHGAWPSDQRRVERWFDTSAFVAGVNYVACGCDDVYGPGVMNFDFMTCERFLCFLMAALIGTTSAAERDLGLFKEMEQVAKPAAKRR